MTIGDGKVSQVIPVEDADPEGKSLVEDTIKPRLPKGAAGFLVYPIGNDEIELQVFAAEGEKNETCLYIVAKGVQVAEAMLAAAYETMLSEAMMNAPGSEEIN